VTETVNPGSRPTAATFALRQGSQRKREAEVFAAWENAGNLWVAYRTLPKRRANSTPKLIVIPRGSRKTPAVWCGAFHTALLLRRLVLDTPPGGTFRYCRKPCTRLSDRRIAETLADRTVEVSPTTDAVGDPRRLHVHPAPR